MIGLSLCVRGSSDDLKDNYRNYQLTAELCSIVHLVVTGLHVIRQLAAAVKVCPELNPEYSAKLFRLHESNRTF